jgi:hypothetical protein
VSARIVATCTRCGQEGEHYVTKGRFAHYPCIECRRAAEHRARAAEKRRRYDGARRISRKARDQEQREARRERARAYQTTPAYRFKAAARRALHRAIAAGKVVRPAACQGCGAQGHLEAHHHRGYEREHRLDVLWLCARCHGEEHRTA